MPTPSQQGQTTQATGKLTSSPDVCLLRKATLLQALRCSPARAHRQQSPCHVSLPQTRGLPAYGDVAAAAAVVSLLALPFVASQAKVSNLATKLAVHQHVARRHIPIDNSGNPAVKRTTGSAYRCTNFLLWTYSKPRDASSANNSCCRVGTSWSSTYAFRLPFSQNSKTTTEK